MFSKFLFVTLLVLVASALSVSATWSPLFKSRTTCEQWSEAANGNVGAGNFAFVSCRDASSQNGGMFAYDLKSGVVVAHYNANGSTFTSPTVDVLNAVSNLAAITSTPNGDLYYLILQTPTDTQPHFYNWWTKKLNTNGGSSCSTSPVMAYNNREYLVAGCNIHALGPSGIPIFSVPFTTKNLVGKLIPNIDQLLVTTTTELRAISLETGKLFWKFVLPSGETMVAPPTYNSNGTHVYVATSAHIYALNQSSGKVFWERTQLNAHHPPVLCGGNVIVNDHALKVVVALDAKTGVFQWQSSNTDGDKSSLSGLACDAQRDILYFGRGSGKFLAYDAKNGNLKATYDIGTKSGSVRPSVDAATGIVTVGFFGSNFFGFNAPV